MIRRQPHPGHHKKIFCTFNPPDTSGSQRLQGISPRFDPRHRTLPLPNDLKTVCISSPFPIRRPVKTAIFQDIPRTIFSTKAVQPKKYRKANTSLPAVPFNFNSRNFLTQPANFKRPTMPRNSPLIENNRHPHRQKRKALTKLRKNREKRKKGQRKRGRKKVKKCFKNGTKTASQKKRRVQPNTGARNGSGRIKRLQRKNKETTEKAFRDSKERKKSERAERKHERTEKESESPGKDIIDKEAQKRSRTEQSEANQNSAEAELNRNHNRT